MLPERVPLEIYTQTAIQLAWPAALVRAVSRQECAEDPRWIRWEKSRWLRYRMASREAQRFDKSSNSLGLHDRWLQFAAMDDVCKSDAAVNPTARCAAMLSHSIGFGQILGDNHKFAGHERVESFWSAMQTMEGQARCFVVFARSSPRLLELGRRFDLRPRPWGDAGKMFRLGDLSEFSSIWNGPGYERNDHDRGLKTHFDFAQREGFDARVA